MKSKYLALLMGATMLLGACASASASNDDSSAKVSCERVSFELKQAKTDLTKAKSDVKDSEDTPNETKANDAVKSAENNVSTLEARKVQCSKETSTNTTTKAPADDKCDGHTIMLPDRKGGRLNAAGVAKPGDAEAFRAQIAQQAAHDPLTLFLYYQASPLGAKNPLPDAYVLAKNGKIENGNCYSAEGVRAYDEWSVHWKYSDIVAVPVIAFQGANTGVAGTQPTHSEGVGGTDKSGYDIQYKDASGKVSSQHSALNRCTQPTTAKAPPNVPAGPTDNPSPSGGKDHRLNVVVSDPNHPDQRVRPVIPAPPEVIRVPGAQPTQPGPPATLPRNPPQVQNPEPIDPGVDTDEPTTDEPEQECPTDSAGIPVDNC
jgi:hypothetical protein